MIRCLLLVAAILGAYYIAVAITVLIGSGVFYRRQLRDVASEVDAAPIRTVVFIALLWPYLAWTTARGDRQ